MQVTIAFVFKCAFFLFPLQDQPVVGMDRENKCFPDKLSGIDRVGIETGVFLCIYIEIPLDDVGCLNSQFTSLDIVSKTLFAFYLFCNIFAGSDQFGHITFFIIVRYFCNEPNPSIGIIECLYTEFYIHLVRTLIQDIVECFLIH